MKKILLALLALVVLAAAVLIGWQNRPSKRYARHLAKARLFVREKNLTAARLEYEAAFNAKDGFTPYASLEVLTFTNQINLQDRHLDVALANTKKFMEANPNSKEGKLILAQLAFQAGETETAFSAIQDVVEKDPDYFPARLLLTQVRTRQGRLDLAEEQLRILYKAHPDSVLSLLPLSENLLRQGRIKEGRELVVSALKDHPNNSSARMMLLDSYLLEGQGDSAQMVLDQWQKADPSLTMPVQVRKAQIQALTGKLTLAESTLAPFIQPKEENAAAYFELAMIKAKEAKYDTAVKIYVAQSELDPAKAAQPLMLTVYLNLKDQNPAKSLETLKMLQLRNKGGELPTLTAVAYMAMGQDSKMTDLIKEQPDSLKPGIQAFLAQLEPNKDFIGQWALVNYYTILRQPRWIASSVEALYKQWPKNQLAQTLWSSQLASTGKYAEAAKLIESMPKTTYSQQVALMGLYIRMKAKPKILAMAQKLLADHPKQRGLNLFLGDYYTGLGDKATAAEYYEKELILDPDNLIALNNLAWEYGINRGDLEKARPYLEKLKAKKMLDPRILDTVGWILAKNGKLDEAAPYFHSALNLVPDYPGFQYHYSCVLNQMGKKDEAKKFLQACVASKIPFDDRKDAEKLLAQGG